MKQKWNLLRSSKAEPSLKERGVAILEFALCSGFLFLSLAGVVDLGRVLNDYATLSRISYEGIRYGATLPGLEAVTCTSDCSNYYVQSALRGRITQLLTLNGIQPALTNFTTSYDPTTRIVEVSIEKQFSALFPMFDWIGTVSAVHAGPYLFPNTP